MRLAEETMMEQTAEATIEREDAQGARASVETRAHAARVEESAVSGGVAAFTLTAGPLLAVGAAAVLTIGDEGLRMPAIITFLLSIAGVAIAHRTWDARCAAARRKR